LSTDNYRRAIGVTTISQLFNYGAPLITFPLMVRYFDISLYGAWIEASTLTSLVYIFGLHGLGNAVGELLVRDSESRDSVFTNALYLFLGIGSALAVLMALLAPWLNSITVHTEVGENLIRVASLLVPISGVHLLSSQIFRLRQQPLTGAISDIGLVMVRIGAALFGYFSRDIVTFAQVFVTSQGAYIFLEMLFAFRGVMLRKPSPAISTGLIRSGINLSVVSQANWVVMFGDRLLLSFFRTSVDVAIYSAAYQLTLIVSGLGWPYLYALLPVLGEKWRAQDIEGVRAALRNNLRWMIIVLLPATWGLALTGNVLISIVATPEFAVSGFMVGLIAFGIALDSLGTNFQYLYYAQGRTHLLPRIFILMALFNIAANLVAIPLYGYVGAGVITLLTFLFSAVLLVKWAEMPLIDVIDFGALWRCLALMIPMTGWVVWQIGPELHHLLIAIGGAVVIYGAGLVILRVITIDQIRSIRLLRK
jgi:O-antigen/teichoic acid export membrane protein